jgi:hypothetical protein
LGISKLAAAARLRVYGATTNRSPYSARNKGFHRQAHRAALLIGFFERGEALAH